MAKPILTDFAVPNPAKSWVPGESQVTAEGDSDPQGFALIGKSQRHQIAQNGAHLLVAQTFSPDAWGSELHVCDNATLELVHWWYAPVVPGFSSLDVLVYYNAVEAVTGGFQLKLVETGQTVDLDTIAAAIAPFERIVRKTWSTSGIETLSGTVTFELYAKSTAAVPGTGNEITGAFIRVNPLTTLGTGAICDAKIVPPDDADVDEDNYSAFSIDLPRDMDRNNREIMKRPWSHFAYHYWQGSQGVGWVLGNSPSDSVFWPTTGTNFTCLVPLTYQRANVGPFKFVAVSSAVTDALSLQTLPQPNQGIWEPDDLRYRYFIELEEDTKEEINIYFPGVAYLAFAGGAFGVVQWASSYDVTTVALLGARPTNATGPLVEL